MRNTVIDTNVKTYRKNISLCLTELSIFEYESAINTTLSINTNYLDAKNSYYSEYRKISNAKRPFFRVLLRYLKNNILEIIKIFYTSIRTHCTRKCPIVGVVYFRLKTSDSNVDVDDNSSNPIVSIFQLYFVIFDFRSKIQNRTS